MESVNKFRTVHLAMAEAIDAWRLLPRFLVLGYSWLLVKVVLWFMSLKPVVISGCNVAELAAKCMYDMPTTQHAALVTAVVGISAAIFAFYTNSGRKWNEGVMKWEAVDGTVKKIKP